MMKLTVGLSSSSSPGSPVGVDGMPSFPIKAGSSRNREAEGVPLCCQCSSGLIALIGLAKLVSDSPGDPWNGYPQVLEVLVRRRTQDSSPRVHKS